MELSTRTLIQFSLSTLILLAIVVLVMVFRVDRSRRVSTDLSSQVATSQAPLNHTITGFRFTSNQDGHRSIDISADRFMLKKKKMGMLRLGLFNEALFQNARIDLYGQRRHPPENSVGTAIPSQKSVNVHSPELGEKYNFGNAFSVETFKFLNLKKIAAVRLAPISIRFFIEDQEKISVRADHAMIAASPRKIELAGNVIWQGGKTELQTDSLWVLLTDNKIQIPGAYRIKRGTQVFSGHKLETDFLLNDVRPVILGSVQSGSTSETTGVAGLRNGFSKHEKTGPSRSGWTRNRIDTPRPTTAFGQRSGNFKGGKARRTD